ncbi:MAG: hypothetical protein NTY19_09850 [Planctomycetota bacterium]|nr:hypothetical protein [Planctomycetota bacterium]
MAADRFAVRTSHSVSRTSQVVSRTPDPLPGTPHFVLRASCFILILCLFSPAAPQEIQLPESGGPQEAAADLQPEQALVGADSSDTPAATGTAAESLNAWRYLQEVPLPATDSNETKWWDFVLSPSVFDAAQPDLADLRVYDAQGREVPYSLQIRSPQPGAAEVPATLFNQVDEGSQVSLDLGERRVEHNAVEVQAEGVNVRRAVLLEGSDDGEKWSKLAEKNLLNFQSEAASTTVDPHQEQRVGKYLLSSPITPGKLVDRTITYKSSRYRYLRVTLQQDPQVDKHPARIGPVTVRRPIQLPGEFVAYPATLYPRESVRTNAGPGSAWTIGLTGNHVPCSRLTVQAAEAEFVRDYRLEAGGPPESQERFYQIAVGEWHRRAGEAKGDVAAEFAETPAARLRLVVIDHRNQPLQIQDVQVAAPARAMIIGRSAELRGPLRLYFGNPKAEKPSYDFDRNLELPLQPSPARLTPGDRLENPAYQPEPLPLTERLPWLIYVLLGVAVGTLGLLISSLARAAIALEDTRQASSVA